VDSGTCTNVKLLFKRADRVEIEMAEARAGAGKLAQLVRRTRAGERGIVLSGLVPGARSLLLSLLAVETGRKILLIVADDTSLDGHQRDLTALAAMLGRDPRKVVAFPALDADPYDGIAPHPEVARERVVGLGRLARGDVDVWIAPARALLAWVPSPEELSLRTRVVARGETLPPDRFVLRGRVSDAVGFVPPAELGPYYERAAVVVCPSRREGYGVVAREAMAYGRPVVASAVGGLTEAVEDGVTGVLVPPRDPVALRAALERLLADRPLRDRLGEAARAWAREQFSWQTATEQTIAAYRTAATRNA